jgi:hypothetical protein
MGEMEMGATDEEPSPSQQPVIGIRSRILTELTDRVTTAYPAFRSYLYFEGAPQPLVPPMRAHRMVVEPDRWQPQPQYYPLVPAPTEAPPSANAVIGVRYGQALEGDLQAVVTPAYQRFPYFEQPAPANPVIPFVRGHWIPETDPWVAWGAYQRFPYWQEPPPPPANPVLAVRYGQLPLTDPEALPTAAYQRFPYWQAPAPAPANPVLPILFRRLEELADRVELVTPRYHAFPYAGVTPSEGPVLRLLAITGAGI